MPEHRLLLAPLADLEAELADTVRGAKEGNPLAPVAVLVGETLLRPYLGRRLATLLGGHANVRFLTAGDLGLALGELALREAGREPLPFLGDQVLTQQAALATQGYFEPVCEMAGFSGALRRTLRELRQAGVGPGELEAAAAAARAEDGDQPVKLADLAALHRAVSDARAPFYDPDDALTAAAGVGTPLEATALVVHGVWELSAALKRALVAVGASVPITVLLPATGTGADHVHAPLRAWLERELGVVADERVPAGAGRRGTGRDGSAGTPTVHLVSAPDPGREVQAVVRACLRWADEGVAFHEMAVAYRHADAYRATLDQAFREAGIPAYLHEGTPLAERPLGRRVLALLDLTNSDDLPRADVVAFLADARLPDATWERYGRASAAQWDAISRDAGVVAGHEQWDERLAAYALEQRARYERDQQEVPEWVQERVARAENLRAFVSDLHTTLSARPGTDTWAEHLAFLRTALTAYVDEPDKVLDSLDGLARLGALAGETSFERFAEAVHHAIDSLRDDDVLASRQGAFGLRGVNVLDVNSLRHLRFRAVAVVGLAERAFPPPPRQDALLLDAERERLNARHGWELPLRTLGADPEPLQFELAVQGASERVHLSYPRTQTGTARALLPSAFYRSAAAELAGRPVSAEEVPDLDVVERVPAGRLGAGEPERALSQAQYARTLLESDRPLGIAVLDRRFPAFPRAREAEAARWLPQLTAYDGVLGPDGVAALAAHWTQGRPVSPSALETYAGCPYRHFLDRILRLKAVRAPEATQRISALDKGALYHRILQRFVVESAGDPPRPERRAEQLERLERIAAEECDRAEAHGETGYAMLWADDRARILDDLGRWYQAEAVTPPADRLPLTDCEVRFGPPWRTVEEEGELSTDDPAEIPVGDGRTIAVQGRIDRLDHRVGGGFSVTDYKTGRSGRDRKPNTLDGGKAIQLALYLHAAGAILGVPPESGRAEYYFATREGEFRHVRFDGEALASRASDIAEVLEGIAGGIAGGDFHAEPSRRCQWCDFDSVCDGRRAQIRKRKAGDERIVAYESWSRIE